MSARLRNLNPYELHKHLVNEYLLTRPGASVAHQRDTSKDKTDLDVIRANSKFLWDEAPADTWEKQLAKKYYDKLFKEYCLCDLSRYKENKVALRWRVEKEVVIGKGQFQCGNKKCQTVDGLRTWEVNFAYIEDREKKNALVKLREDFNEHNITEFQCLCPECSEKLNHHSKKREIKRLKQSKRKSKSSKRQPKVDDGDGKAEVEEATPSVDTSQDQGQGESSVWKKDAEPEEKSREEEFEEYLEDLLL